ncbi:MAG: DUF1330 domain-containing protein [Gammaproteobacteria bacterium]|nr:DUF1330 domain-containing protein [Gammaproteobacteria bacterium]
MAAYMIIFVTISDREKFISGYAPAASKLVEKFGGRYLLRAQGAEILEGDLDPGSSVVISEWPDKATALDFWNSDEYQAVKQLRAGIASARVALIEAPLIAEQGDAKQ